MLESGLTITLNDLLQQTCYLLFGSNDPTVLSAIDLWNLRRTINKGLRRFYYPKQADRTIYDWSFLRQDYTLLLSANTQDYPQPFDFGGIQGNLQHDPNDNMRLPVTKVSVDEILRLRGLNLQISSWPIHYAERARGNGGRSSTRWEVMIWPTPSATYTLKGMSRIQPLGMNLTQANPAQIYPYGGEEHSETILASCLAMAELLADGEPGPMNRDFEERLAASIALDQTMHQPELLGYNGDHRFVSRDPLMRDNMHFENFSPVTLNGVNYSG